tara:strand:+ start:1332 stop:1757 length:426 start_codon:yes stop_codon:yes gene_type:complete
LEISYLDTLYQFITNYKKFIFWLGSISAVIFVFSLLSIKWLVALIPSDYFIKKEDSKFKKKYPFLWFLSLIIKNIFGYSLIIGGIFMLILPGQGVFTIMIGLMLSNYPGKYAIEKKFIAIPSVLKGINWLRKKSNEPPINI